MTFVFFYICPKEIVHISAHPISPTNNLIASTPPSVGNQTGTFGGVLVEARFDEPGEDEVDL